MPDEKTDPVESGHPGFGYWLARAIVWLRFLIIPAWIVAAVLASTGLPSIFNAETSSLGNLLPRSSKPLEVEERALKTFGLPLLSRTIVVASESAGFTPRQNAAAARYIGTVDSGKAGNTLRAAPLPDAPGVLYSRRPGTTLVTYLYIDPELNDSESGDAAHAFAAGLQRATGARHVEVTGAIPASVAETNIANEYILWVELATILLVAGILAFHFRSIGIPLLGLTSVAVAYQVADHVLGWMGDRYGLEIPQEVEPVVIALLFGTLTDYVVFFVSDYRRRLLDGEKSHLAATEATAELLPVILTAALMIAGATLTLLLSGVRFLSAFGPGMAVSVVIGAAVAVTFVPAVLAAFGPALLWPWKPSESDRRSAEDDPEAGTQGHLVGFAANHPAIVIVASILVLGAAATGLRDMALGNPLIRGLPDSSSPKKGYDAAAASFGPGVLGPTMLVLEEPGIAKRQAALGALRSRLDEVPGVSGVAGPTNQPVGKRSGVLLSPDGNAARFILILRGDPDGSEAGEALSGLEEELPAILRGSGLQRARAGITGDTTIATELAEDTWSALARVAPAALALLVLLLWILLRSWTAPLYLVGVSVLTVAAALGLTVYVFQGLLGYEDLAFFVPVATSILLLALGADYNVFLISRIWREADRQDLRPAIRTAGSRAARAITVAGLILALSFAAVALIPIEAFREMAFAMSVGLLLDTLIARTFLIPALVSQFGRGARDDGPPVSAPSTKGKESLSVHPN
jgi:putative drug exporter of the RND superfamily